MSLAYLQTDALTLEPETSAGRFSCMATSSIRNTTRFALIAMTSAAFALGAAKSYATENVLVLDDGNQRVWHYTKSDTGEVSTLPRSSVIRAEEQIPALVVPLNTAVELEPTQANAIEIRRQGYTIDNDIAVDLVQDNPIFIGTPSQSEFDTFDAQRERAAMPKGIIVEPLLSVAGAGIETTF